MGSAEYIEEQQLQKGSDFHSPTTYLDPPYQRKPPTAHILWQFLNFIMFYTIQIIYFLKAGDTHYPLIMNHSDDVDILQYCSSTGPSVSRFGIFSKTLNLKGESGEKKNKVSWRKNPETGNTWPRWTTVL